MGFRTGIALILIGLCTMASVAFSQEAEEIQEHPAAQVEAPADAPGPDPIDPPPPSASEPGPYVTNE